MQFIDYVGYVHVNHLTKKNYMWKKIEHIVQYCASELLMFLGFIICVIWVTIISIKSVII